MIKAPILLPKPKQISCQKIKVSEKVLYSTPLIEFDENLPKEGYKLVISVENIKIIAADKAGEFYAKQTLKQLIAQYKNSDCPVLEIYDFPDIAMRGVSLDVSRDRVPFFKDLLEFIDLLASWKINTFTLYFEHVFAYKKHKKVWENAAAFTAEDIQKLDQYCKERFIDLIPAQETLGHLSRWLCHDPYRQLAECPEGYPSSWRLSDTDPFSLCPTDPESLNLMEELLDELLPNFSSQYFFCGGDETFDIGTGRSKEVCEQIGLNKVYGNYFEKIGKIAHKNGKKIIIYSDMVKNNSEACSYLPKDAILAEWGYGRNYPFEKNAKGFIDSGLKFCFLSSNSNYSTFGGRTYRWRGNIINAVSTAIKLNAVGYFNHEFGDFGHWTQFSFSLPAFAFGAALSWNFEGNKDEDLAAALDLFAYENSDGAADLIMAIGKIYNHTSKIDDSDTLYSIFYQGDWEKDCEFFSNLTLDNLKKTKEDALDCFYRLQRLPACPEKVKKEIETALLYINFAIHAATELVTNENVKKIKELPLETQVILATEFTEVIEKLLQIRDEYYQFGGRREALLYLKRYWENCCSQIPFPEKFLI